MRLHSTTPGDQNSVLDPLEPRLLMCATSVITADLTTGLIARWSFEQAGAVAIDDVSGQAANHDGTLLAGAFSFADALCGTGGARFVGGASEMSVGNHNEINVLTHGQRSVSLWFNADNIDIDTRRQVLYEEGAGTRGLSIYLDDGRLYAGGWNRVVGESDWDGTWFSTDRIANGGWHHVVLTLDGGPTLEAGALNAYLDGQRFGSGEGSQLWPHGGDITLGNGNDTRFADGSAASGSQGFAGLIDEARLYNRALSAHDVAVLSGRFNEGAAITVARAKRFDLIAESKPVTDPEPSPAPDEEEVNDTRAKPDALNAARPITFATADVDRAKVPEALSPPDDTAPPPEAGPPPAEAAQANGDHPGEPSQTDENGDATEVAQGDDAPADTPSTAQVDEPKRDRSRGEKQENTQERAPERRASEDLSAMRGQNDERTDRRIHAALTHWSQRP